MYSFDQIVGNEKLIYYFQNSVKRNKVPHAFILDGPQGIGKKRMANTFAKTLQCERGGAAPCNTCLSCKIFENNNHPDVLRIGLKEKKSLGIDDIRGQINEVVAIKPYKYPYKIFIIDAAQTMTVQAQNALLKTIEEPPAYAKFFLLSSGYQSFLSTILSRCVLLKLKPLSEKQVMDYCIQEKKMEPSLAQLYAVFSGGNIGQAIAFSEDETFRTLRNEIVQILKELKHKNMIQLFALAKELESFKEQIAEVLEMMYLWFRDVLIYQQTGDKSFVLDKENFFAIQSQSMEYSSNALYNTLDAIAEAKKSLQFNSNFQLTLEIMLFRIKEMVR